MRNCDHRNSVHHHALTAARNWRRRATVVTQVAVTSTLLLGMGALALDIGAMYATRTELQAAADAAALAAAQRLVGDPSGKKSAVELAREAAEEFSAMHNAWGNKIQLGSGDIVFGRSAYNPNTQKFTFRQANNGLDSVRVTTRRSRDSAAGALALSFANVFGISHTNLQAQAAAVLIPRDIAVVIDLSGSMTWDSSLKFYDRTDGGFPNTRDIWAALNGPEPSRPYIPGSELETEYAGDTGPPVGGMTQWGQPLLPGAYTPATDNRLVYLRRNVASVVSNLVEGDILVRGFSLDETSTMLSSARDGNMAHWQRRAGAILGLTDWRSGRPGGKPGGNADTTLDAAEVTWSGYPPGRGTWTWTNYIDFVQSGSVSNSAFRYQYGLKTFVDFLLTNRPRATESPTLWATPQLPLRAVKDAVQAMVDVIEALNSLDHMSLEIFATTSRHELDLSNNLQGVADTLYRRQAGHYDTATNIGAGLQAAITELNSSRARGSAKKIIVLMSDGIPNIDPNGTYVGDGAPTALSYAYDQAAIARDQGILVYAVSVGYGVDRTVLQTIASIAGGQEFYAAGSPEEYTEQLQMIFRALGGKRPVALIE